MKLLLHVRGTDVTSYGGPHAPPIEALVPAMNGSLTGRLGPFGRYDEEVFEKAKALGQESSIIVTGTVKTDERSSSDRS